MLTLIPESVMAGVEEFTLSWVTRCLRPDSGYAGMVFFYDNMETVEGIDYFGGYDNFTYAGYADNYMNNWAAFSTYGGKTTHFQSANLKTMRTGANQSIYASVHCTKGEYQVDGVTYTAKIESYSDDQHVCTSYAMWADAPVMFYYENPSSRWSVQFTNIKLDVALPEATTVEKYMETAAPTSISGTAVRYSGGPGLRFYADLEKDVLYENATEIQTGVIMVEREKFTGELTVDTPDAIKHDLHRVDLENDSLRSEIFDFTDPGVGEKIYYARSYAIYTIGGKTFYAYSPMELASCARTSAKVLSAYGADTRPGMVDACREMAGPLATVRIMSLNMLLAGDPKQVDMYNAALTWQMRLESTVNMIVALSPDVVALQEAVTASQIQTLMSYPSISSVYDCIGSADDRGSGKSGEEGIYILYKRDMFALESNGVKYLSDNPDMPHSLIGDAKIYNASVTKGSTFKPRKLVWALLSHKASGEKLTVASTHLAFSASDTELDYLVRNKQAALATKMLSDGSLFDQNIPYILVGDMNAKTNSAEYNVFLSEMEDLRYMASKTAPDTQGTYHSYVDLRSGTFIDHAFASRGDFAAASFQIITQAYKSETLGKNILPSDHYAIMAEVTVLPE